MPERDLKSEHSVDPRKKHDIDAPTAALLSTFSGGMFGGISYGISRFALDENLANRIGLGVGFGVGGLMAGTTLSIVSQEEALQHAIRGEVGRSRLKVLKSSVEAAMGYGSAGFISGYEARGFGGAAIGAVAGTVVGFGGMYQTGSRIPELAYAYKNLIIPVREPSTFPEYNVTRDPRFNENEVNSFVPPVYQAPNIGVLKGFRSAQLEKIYSESKNLKGIYRHPNVLVFHLEQAVFIVPDVTHYPVQDPKTDKFLFGKLEEPSERIQLNSPGESLIAKPYKEGGRLIWPYGTEFQRQGEFNEEQWKYWKEISWKKSAVILAKRTVNRDKVKEQSECPVDEEYFLIDILLDSPERGIKKRKKLEREVKQPSPVWEPNSL